MAGFLVNLVWGRRLGEPAASWVGTAAAGSFLAALVTWVGMLGRPAPERVADLRIFTWFPVAGLHAGAGLLVDPLSMTMALFVTGVSAVIHMSSVGYMHRDPGLDRFFVYLNLFVFSMAVLVLGDNFVFSFLGWEGVGFCSYALIGFWFRRDVAAVAANKAFFTNWSSPTARYQGAVAAKNMLGRPLAYDQVPYFFSGQYDLGIEFRGWAPSFDRVVFRGDPASSQFIAFWLQDGKVSTAAMNANVWDVGVEIEPLLRAGQPVDLGRLTDPDVELALNQAKSRPFRRNSEVCRGIWGLAAWGAGGFRVKAGRRPPTPLGCLPRCAHPQG